MLKNDHILCFSFSLNLTVYLKSAPFHWKNILLGTEVTAVPNIYFFLHFRRKIQFSRHQCRGSRSLWIRIALLKKVTSMPSAVILVTVCFSSFSISTSWSHYKELAILSAVVFPLYWLFFYLGISIFFKLFGQLLRSSSILLWFLL